MDSSISRVGSGNVLFKNDNVLIAAGALLLITGLALTILGSMQVLGPLTGAGTITILTLGSINLIAALVIGGLLIRQKFPTATAAIPTTTCTPEQLARVKWKIASDGGKERFGAVYQPLNLIHAIHTAHSWFYDYVVQPQEKMVLVMTIMGFQAHSVYGEPNSPDNLFVQKYQAQMGERLLVLFDLEQAFEKSKVAWQNPNNARGNISQEPVWNPIFDNNRWICTEDPQWRQKLDAFIAR